MARKRKSSLTPIQSKALSGIDAKGIQRDSIEVGTHHVDFTIRVHGSLNVLEDEDYTPTIDLLSLPVIVLAIQRMGCTRDAFVKALTDIAADAIERGESVTESVRKEVDSVKLNVDKLKKLMEDKLPKVKRSGKVLKAIEIETIESTEVIEEPVMTEVDV